MNTGNETLTKGLDFESAQYLMTMDRWLFQRGREFNGESEAIVHGAQKPAPFNPSDKTWVDRLGASRAFNVYLYLFVVTNISRINVLGQFFMYFYFER